MSLIAYSYINTCARLFEAMVKKPHKIIVTNHEADASSKVYVQEKLFWKSL